MPKGPRTLTPVQIEIMDLFWDHGELGVAQVWKLLGERRPIARNTVQTMLSRLAEKGWLQSRAEGNAFYFRAARPRKSALSKIAGQLVDTVFAGSASRLFATLLESRRISPDEAQRIRELIDRAEEERP
jgi:predicted transcriptional regulator